jgi:acyl-CoA dehydrogenase
MAAIETGDGKALFRALLGHAGFFLRNFLRCTSLGISQGGWARSPVDGPTAVYYRRLSWASARFALLTDLASLSLGSRLKLREKISGRFADVLSWMYLGFCALRRFEAEGRRAEDLPLVRWAAEHALFQIQTAFEGIYLNLDGPIGALLRARAWRCRSNPIGEPPADRLGAEVADVLRHPGELRDRLTAGISVPVDASEALARLERAFALASEAAPLIETIARASRKGDLPRRPPETILDEAVAAGVVTPDEALKIREAASAREDALQVDSFPRGQPRLLSPSSSEASASIASRLLLVSAALTSLRISAVVHG